MTWGDVGAFFVVIVVGSFVAGFVDTWWEQRKWHKEQRKWDKRRGVDQG